MIYETVARDVLQRHGDASNKPCCWFSCGRTFDKSSDIDSHARDNEYVRENRKNIVHEHSLFGGCFLKVERF